METLRIIVQVVIALGILNVWLLRYNKATPWRGGEAKNMMEEFAAYGLPSWFAYLIGFLKVAFAVLLVVGIWVPVLTQSAAAGVAVLMAGAILMHVRVKDPLKRSLPAATMLVLSLFVALV